MQNAIHLKISLPNAEQLDRYLAIAIGALLIGHLATSILSTVAGVSEGFGLIPLFDFDTEQNLPTYFSVQIIVASAICVLAHTLHKRSSGLAWSGVGIAIAAVIFLVSVDEFASVHERIGGSLSYYVETEGVFHHAWLIPYLFAAVLLAPIALKWLLSLPATLAIRVVYAGSLYLFGAVGLEMIAGVIESSSSISENVQAASLFATMPMEECLEMAGMALFLVFMFEEVSGDQGAAA